MVELHAPILTFDSGFGGLTVFRHLLKELPNHDHLYVADDLSFPVGGWRDDDLLLHCMKTLSSLIEKFKPSMVVIACNTESTLILPALRKVHALPFVGTVPAIKPAAEQTKSGYVSVLATAGTVKRDYTKALINTYANNCKVALVGSNHLAGMAEKYLLEDRLDEAAVFEEILPCFIEDNKGARTDFIALACTHYPLLLPVLEKLAPWPVKWFDPAPAIAQRALSLLPDRKHRHGRISGIMTSGKDFPYRVLSA